MNIAVFASGKGTNFQAIIQSVKKGFIKARLSLLVCDNPKAPALLKARRAKITTFLAQRKSFASGKDFEAAIVEALRQERIDLIVLAGFMRILSPGFVRRYQGRILNIHPALLPAFKGTAAIHDALDYGAKVTGVTVHFVDEKIDHGPIILQAPVLINHNDTRASLETKIHALEHTVYPQAIKLFVERKLRLTGRRVKILTR
jgi:phosphoribosylglycinamide formyltransferase-1